nr:MAG TPA: hypothetical protein [Caudoviricetes sp.]
MKIYKHTINMVFILITCIPNLKNWINFRSLYQCVP